MMTPVKSLRVGLLMLLVSVSAAVFGAENQFYFVAKNDSLGVIQQGVFLRWDVVEGALPPSVTQLRLMRKGSADAGQWVQLGEWDANTVMPAEEIEKLYAGPDEQRLKLETITRLNELASDSGVAFSPSQFAGRIHGLINPANLAPPGATAEQQLWSYNSLWAYLGSKTDFNIARARYRAFYDASPGTGIVEYELLGVNGAQTARLGFLRVDLNALLQPLPATQFEQILATDTRCDLPESAKDHFTVMLNWRSPGEGQQADRIAAQAYSSGFDLYRGTENLARGVTVPPARNIASLAASAASNSRGEPQIDGLEKVNVALIVDPGATTEEPKWMEARDLLGRAGLQPGDRRAYYLVPRDFTGGYGPTAATIVEVPELTRPPAPWNLRTFADETTPLADAPGAYTIMWDPVMLQNYTKMYQGTRLFCNYADAEQTGILEYVAIGDSCETSTVRNAVRLDVDSYKVYRFTDFDVAGQFKDSDGDGVADRRELDLNADGEIDPAERAQGMHCNADVQPNGAPNYLVDLNNGAELLYPDFDAAGTIQSMRFRDRVPADQKDTVFWYRVAAEVTSAADAKDVPGTPTPPPPDADTVRLSFLSAPQRGLFPDRTPPPEPIVEVTTPEVEEGCEVEFDANGGPSFNESVTEKGGLFELNCTYTQNGQQVTEVISNLTRGGVSNLDGPACQEVTQKCGATQQSVSATETEIVFPASSTLNGKECRATLPNDAGICVTGAINVVPAEVEVPRDVVTGEIVPDGPMYTIKPPNDKTCIAFYENMDGSATRLGSTCDKNGISFQPLGRNFCGYAVATDQNNNISTTVQFPCTLSPVSSKAPSPPQVLTISVDNDYARITFRVPAEQIAMAIGRLIHEVGGGRSSALESIPVIDNQSGEAVSFAFDVEPLQGERDTFCVSMLSVGREDGRGNASRSDWSTERCYTRTALGEDNPVYMPWPLVEAPPQGEPLVGEYVDDFRTLVPFIGLNMIQRGSLARDDCTILAPGQVTQNDPLPDPDTLTDFDSYTCGETGYNRFQSAMGSELGFILYRQSRIAGAPGTTSEWNQVAPFIDYIHFDRSVLPFGDRLFPIWTLNDPYFEIILKPAGSAPKFYSFNSVQVRFIDRYPFAATSGGQPNEWRYQAVYFDADHRPVKWRVSDWFGSATP